MSAQGHRYENRKGADSLAKRQAARVMRGVRKAVKGDRLGNLAKAMAAEIEEFTKQHGRKPKLLDYGCGDMQIAHYIHTQGLAESIHCVDIHPPQEGEGLPYTQLQKADALPFEAGRFDMAIVVDVLHHVGIEEAPKVIAEIARCAPLVVVKDHFEFGPISRQVLRLADWYGNWTCGVNVPDRYYSVNSWRQGLTQANAKELRHISPVTIHEGLFGLIVPPRCHFIAWVRV